MINITEEYFKKNLIGVNFTVKNLKLNYKFTHVIGNCIGISWTGGKTKYNLTDIIKFINNDTWEINTKQIRKIKLEKLIQLKLSSIFKIKI